MAKRTRQGAGQGKRTTEQIVEVEARQGAFPVYTFDEEGKKVKLGDLRYRDYEQDRRLRVPVLLPAEEGAKERILGRASGQYRMVDHWTAAEPIMEYGLTPTTLHHYRGGAELVSFFSTEDEQWGISDPIIWDRDIYGKSNKLFMAVRLKSSFRVGVALRFTMGLWRQVCVNGLVVSWMSFGNLQLGHNVFDAETVLSWLGKCIEGFHDNAKAMNKQTLPVAALNWPINALEQLIEVPEEAEAYLAGQPRFAAAPLRLVHNRLPQWGLAQLHTEMVKARDTVPDISRLDVVNMLTNVSNNSPRRSDERPIAWEVYRRMDALGANVMSLVEIGAFQAGVPFFQG